MNPVRPIEILLVEDSPSDVRLTREALKEAKVVNMLHVAQDGIVALEFLRKHPEISTESVPWHMHTDIPPAAVVSSGGQF